MFFSFAGGQRFSLPWAVLDYFPSRLVRESCMVHDAHLFILQLHSRRFRDCWWGEMVLLFSVWHGLGRISMGWASRMSQRLILIDFCLLGEKKRKRGGKKRNDDGGYFAQGQTCLAGCAAQDFHDF
jgi:hypothetical protein